MASLVDGTSIDSHGDAHADDGFCAANQKGRSSWRVKETVQSYFEFKLLRKRKNNKMQLILQNIAKHITLSKEKEYFVKSKSVNLKPKVFY
jgi:predicted ATPase with chaperone activity